MTTTPKRPSSTERSSTSRRTILIAGGLLAALVIVIVIVALASGGDSADETPRGAAHIPTDTTFEVSPVTITGDPLPRFDPAELVDPAVGQKAPGISASYFDDTQATLGLDDGKPHVLIFLAHWCPHCQAEVPRLTEWMDVNGVPDDVEIVAVSTAVDSGAPNYPPSAWLLREGWPVPVLRDSRDGELATAFGLSGFPYIVVVSGDGTVLVRNSGEVPVTQWEDLLAVATAS